MADGGGIGIGKPASMISTLQEEEGEMGPTIMILAGRGRPHSTV